MSTDRRSGVYAIENRETGDFYIGRSLNIRKRWNAHRSLLRRQKHPNAHLQNSWRKYGAQSFDFFVLELTHPAELRDRELQWCESLRPKLNKSYPEGRCFTFRHSEETKTNMSISRKGVSTGPFSTERRTAISTSLSGRKLSESHKENIRNGCRRHFASNRPQAGAAFIRGRKKYRGYFSYQGVRYFTGSFRTREECLVRTEQRMDEVLYGESA